MSKINYILKQAQLVDYADNINIMNRKKRGIHEVSEAREEIRKKQGLTSISKKKM